MNEIMKQKTAEEISWAYQESQKEIEAAYNMLAKAEKRLRDALGNSVDYTGIYAVDRYTCGSWNSERPAETINGIMYKIRAATWRRIVERLGIRQIMSSKERDALDERLSGETKWDSRGTHQEPLQEPTVENIMALFMHYADSATDKLESLVMEVFKLLTPGKYWDVDYKTNSQFRIGKKVILAGWCSSWSRHDDDLMTIDRCFHILDGKGASVKGYGGPLYNGVKEFSHWGHMGGSGETEYFKYKVYQNGNLHLEFKRMDLVNKINQIGGDGYHLGKGKGK